MNYLTEDNILYRHQTGFHKNHSTDTPLAYLTDKILTGFGFDSVLLTRMILIDLQKAFDTINHDILLKKMSALRFSDCSINLVSIVSFRQKFSRKFLGQIFLFCENWLWGAPGIYIVISLLLFLLYANDKKQAVDCDFFLYAADSCLVYQHKDVKEIETNLNKNFSDVCDWFADIKLCIHFGEDKKMYTLWHKT